MRSDYQRLSLVQLSKGSKRPEVFSVEGALAVLGYYRGGEDGWFGKGLHGGRDAHGKAASGLIKFQADNGLQDDGILGKRTATVLVRQATEAGWKPDLVRQIQALITYYEVTTTKDAYGMSEADIGDGAGANYGFMQTNNLGSVVHVLKLAGANHLIPVYQGKDKDEAARKAWLKTPGLERRAPALRKIAVKAASELEIKLAELAPLADWEDVPAMASYWEDAVAVFSRAYIEVPNPTIQSWYGSAPGIDAQNRYFAEVVLQVARRQMKDLPELAGWEGHPDLHRYWERAFLLFCDTTIQNGGMWSSYARPFWKDMVGSERYSARHNVAELFKGKWWDELLGEYIPYETLKELWWAELKRQQEAHPDSGRKANRNANRSLCRRIMEENIPDSDPVSKLVLLAQWRSRTSSPKWWYQAVASRRMTDATGHGTVNRAEIDLVADYHLGVPREAPDSPMTIRETFIKDTHADILEKHGLD